MKKIIIIGIFSILNYSNSFAEAFQFNCELAERTSSNGVYKEIYKYKIEKEAEIAERKFEVFKKENGTFINLIDLSDEYMKKEHKARQAWKTINAKWTVDNLIFSLTNEYRDKITEIIDRTSLQFVVRTTTIVSGIKLDADVQNGTCKVEKIKTKERAF